MEHASRRLIVLLGLAVLGSGPWDRSHVEEEPQASAWSLSEEAEGVASRSLSVALDELDALVPGDAVAFELPGGGSLDGVVRRREERSTARYTLSGDCGKLGSFVLAINQGVLAAFVHDPERGAYRVRLTPGRAQVIEPVATDELLACRTEEGTFTAPARDEDPRLSTLRLGTAPPPVLVGGREVDLDDAVPRIDVLVVYTRMAQLDAGGVAAIEAEIDLMMEWGNVVYVNSDIQARMNLVYARALVGTPLPTIQQLAGRNDGVLDAVHGLRDAYGADQVALIQYAQGGIALGLSDLTPQSEATAFCINGRESAPNVLAHELGHNMGCCHALGQGGGCPLNMGLLFPFSTGYSFTGNTGVHFTAMAGGLLQHFSEPRILFDGAPTGVFAGDGGHPGAENARTVTLSAPTVSSWRVNDRVCELLDLAGDAPDCDNDLIPDACEIALGLSTDANGNSIPDECEPQPLTDLNGDGRLDLADFVTLRLHFGTVGGVRRADGDLDGDGRVDLDDVRIFADAFRAARF